MPRTPVDLAAHMNATVTHGQPADFPVGVRSVAIVPAHPLEPADKIPKRKAIIREDTGGVLAIVSDRYTVVRHQRILDLVDAAIAPLDVGPVPRGVFVDRSGARMRALYKFPALAQSIKDSDTVCPCLKIQNTYDGTSRISIVIGAFRFVCTNFAVGGGGAFAGGFVAVHAGAIDIERVTQQLAAYLEGFDAIILLYRQWIERAVGADFLAQVLKDLPNPQSDALAGRLASTIPRTVFDAYNVLTSFATHETRSARIAFDLLERVNRQFQRLAPVTIALEVSEHAAKTA